MKLTSTMGVQLQVLVFLLKKKPSKKVLILFACTANTLVLVQSLQEDETVNRWKSVASCQYMANDMFLFDDMQCCT